MDAQVGTRVDAQMDAWVRHMAGQPALPYPNPISTRLLVRVSKIPRCTVPLPAPITLAQQVHQHPQHPHAYARDAVVGRGCEISGSRQQGGRQIQNRCTTGWPALAAPHVSPVSYHVAPIAPVTYHGIASWAAITAVARPQTSHAGAILGSPRCRAGRIKSHFADYHVLHPRR